MPLRILHSADWQIGRRFDFIAGDTGALLREQRFEAVRRLAALAAQRAVDAVLVAGDVFDDNAVADETLRRTMGLLDGFQGPWVLLPGNHDPARAVSVWSRIRRLGILPAQVHLALEPVPVVLAAERLCVLPAPLRRRHEPADASEWFDHAPSPEGAMRVGLAHGSVTNRLPPEAEAHNPVDEHRAERARLDYLALGDWHGTLEIAPRSWYSGTPEPDRFRSRDAGNALLVELDGPGAPPRVERLALGHYRWLRREYRIDGRDGVEVLRDGLAELADPERTLLSLELSGALDLTARDALEELLGSTAARLRHLRVDAARLEAAPSEADLDSLELSGFLRGAFDELRRRQQAAGDDDERAAAALALQILFSEQRALLDPEP